MIYGLILFGIWLISCGLIFYINRNEFSENGDFFGLFIFIMMVSVICLILFMGISISIRHNLQCLYDSSDTIPIVSVRSNSGINGVFVWGSGSINNVEQYVCYKQVDGMIKQVILNASDTWIIEDADSSDANIERRYVIYDKTTALYKWFYIGKNKPWLYENYLHVPKGSVVYQYNIN
ncbi:MAG: hypothetical protein PHF86_12915 [Candidatus Nanoarchaeia archaeon]|nr:hypothetical protein [Candidatus Nanoarchaeia archaeon]